MDLQQILAVNIVVISALAMAGTVVQGAWRGNTLWLAVNGLIVASGMALLQWAPEWAGTAVALLFLPFIAGPLLLARLTQSRLYQRRMKDAARFARYGSWLHPTRHTRLTADMLEAQAAEGLEAQKAALLRLAARSEPAERALIGATVLRLEGRWEELRTHLDRNPGLARILGSARVRLLGELGLVDQMTRAYEEAKSGLHGVDLAEAQLFVLAFAGRPAEVARLLAGPLDGLDVDSKTYWSAIADRNAGGDAAGWRTALAHLAESSGADGVRRAAARALATDASRTLRIDDVSSVIVEECAARVGRAGDGTDRRGGATPVTWTLLGLIAAVYLLSEVRGGSQSMRNLVELGALWPPYVLQREEWWRLGSALFLHWGPLHAGVNGFMLLVLGSGAERAYGSFRMAVIYVVGGLASSTFVLWLAAAGLSEPSVLVGASGAIMALFGAIVGRTVVVWLRHRDVLDARNLAMMGLIVLLQVGADLMLPQVSLAAHASGFTAGLLVGVLMTAFLRERSGRRQA